MDKSDLGIREERIVDPLCSHGIPSLLFNEFDAAHKVRSDFVRRNLAHRRIPSVALAQATDALLLAEELVIAGNEREEPELGLHDTLHARESHIPTLPVSAHFRDEVDERELAVQTGVLLSHGFGLVRCVLHEDHSTFVRSRCQA